MSERTASAPPPLGGDAGVLGAGTPVLRTAVPGPESLAWLRRFGAVAAPMGPRSRGDGAEGLDAARLGALGTVVYAEGHGSNVIDVDGNVFVDLAAGFGSLLLGHDPAPVRAAIAAQSGRLLQSLGDMHPSAVKIELLERLSRLCGGAGWQAISGQSGADAISAALKTALLCTGRPGVVAFTGAYHGLSYAPLALCGLRESYRRPFAAQLSPAVRFVDYPAEDGALDRVLGALERELARGDVGAVVYEPILGRGGCVVPPARFGVELGRLCRAAGSLLVADEIWTGLGRSGEWLFSRAQGADPDLICLGKGLGGGLPLSACLGRREWMSAWSQPAEVVHTSTFAGAPLASAAALALLDAVESERLVERAAAVGARFRAGLERALARAAGSGLHGAVTGAGLMLAVELGARPGVALEAQRRLLARGYIVSLGGTTRESVVLTPALDIAEPLLDGFIMALSEVLGELAA